MPKFSFTSPDGKGCVTEYVECIPWDSLNSMAAAGVKFRVDGKLISKQKLIETYYNKPTPSAQPASADNSKATSGKFKIKCIETGQMFDKQSEAARSLGIDPAQVSDSIKTGKKRSGYTFEKVPV